MPTLPNVIKITVNDVDEHGNIINSNVFETTELPASAEPLLILT